MDTWTAAFLLTYFLFTSSVQSAPAGSLSSLPLAFQETAVRAKTLVDKILKDIPAAHGAAVSIQGFSLDSSTETSDLQMMEASMEIPAPPVLEVSKDFPLDTCVSRMTAGVQMYQNLLDLLSTGLSGLEDLRSDLRDLLSHMTKLKEAAQLEGEGLDPSPGLDPVHLQGSYRVQVAVHLTLAQLRSFCHDLVRTFRFLLTTYTAAGTR